MADNIFDKYRKTFDEAATEVSGDDSIFSRYRVPVKEAPIVPENPARFPSVEAGIKKGVLDTANTLNTAADYISDTIRDDERVPTQKGRIKEQNTKYEKEFGNNTAANIGRLGGQVLSTAAFVPSSAIKGAFQSAPIIAALGEGVANKLGMHMTAGAAGGAVYGAGINSTNDEGLASNVGTNTALGAIGAPVIAGAGKLGSMVIPGYRSLKANAQVIMAARNAGVPTSAVRNVIGRLEDAGLTPEQAQVELSRLGSKATIADLDPALTSEASGLAALGGKPTSILKNRFGARADQANSAAADLVVSRLGPKPDMEVEKQAILDHATILTGPDYKTAKVSGVKLDPSNIVAHIDSELDKAVGREASELEKAKGYLYNTKGELKTDVASLHKVRQALDDTMSRLPKEGTSQGTATYRAVSTIRDLVDSQLKTVPEMASADANFARHMKVKEGLQIGYNALTKKTNKDEFIKIFNAASPEMQDTIRKGLHAAMIDVMEQSGQGEASGIQRLLNKKAINKEIVRAAFGTHGENIINAVHDEVAQRGTERAVTQGSQTAERTAIRERYESQGRPHLGDIALGTAIDAYGGGGAALAATTVKRGLVNRLIARSENKLGALTEGTADLLSRQGAERDIGMDVVNQVEKIQNRLRIKSGTENILSRLPKLPTLSAPFGGEAYSKIKEKVQ